MPRIRQNAEQDAIKDLVGEINAQRARFGYNTFQEFGKVLGVCQKSAWNYLKDPDSIRLGTMRKIVKVLKPDPVYVLLAIGYSTKDIKKIKKEEST